MQGANPFRQRLRRKNTTFKTVVWQANEEGKDNSTGKTDFALNDEYLWMSYDFSVPLRWITTIEDLGPGFAIGWENPLQKTKEWAAFCVRTMFGYNRKRRDDLVLRIREAVARARTRPEPVVAAAAATIPRCQVCGDTDPAVYDFEWMISVVHLMLNKPDRRILCRKHGRWRARLVCASNLVTSNLGFGAFISPIFNMRNVQVARHGGALGSLEGAIWTTIGFAPYAVLALLVGWAIWFAIHF